MRFSTLAAAVVPLAATLVAAAQASSLPACAQLCFLRAIGETTCAATDFYCQCTKGAKIIQKSAIPCLCANVGTSAGCSVAELLQAQKYSNDVCVAALSSSSQTYTPITTNQCAAAATGTTNNTASTTATGGEGTGRSSATTGAASSSTSGNGVPAVTNMAMLGFAGMMMAAL